jgi:lipopolysaccharide transport system ATP-binding protein
MGRPIITVEGLGKKYLLTHQQREPYTALRDVISEKVKGLGRRIARPFSGVSSPRSDPGLEEFWALRNVSFEVNPGDRVGIIGRNGAGKSTLLKILSRITEPTEGRIRLRGRVASLLEVGTGFHPELTGRENIFLNGAVLGMSKAEIRRKFDEIVDFAEVEKFLDTPVKRYSSGMYVRLAFSVAAHLEPEILVVDEVLAVGDAQFQKKCLGKMEDATREEGRTILFVSHNMGAVRSLCNRSIVLENGTINYIGDVHSAVDKYYLGKDLNKSFVRWDPAGAPSTPSANMIEAGLLSDSKPIGSEVPTELPIQVYIKFTVKNPSKIGTSLILENSEGQMIFVSISNHEPNWHGKIRPEGSYLSTCEIPPNFLASGRYSVSIPFWEGHYESGIVVKDILQFTAYENGLVRGDLPYEFNKNVMAMPLLQWISKMETSPNDLET